MSLLRDLLQLISTQPGAPIYYVVTLFAIQLIAAVAIGHWQRRRDDAATQLLVMGGGLLLTRLVLVLVAVLGDVGLISLDAILPPLERFLHLTTVVLTIWAFLPIVRQAPRLSTGVLIIIILIAAGTYAAFAATWPGVEAAEMTYNGHWQERVWEVSTTTIIAIALVANSVWRESEWAWLSCLFLVWLTGHGLQLASPVPEANLPGWVRLASMAALPLLGGLVYRRVLTSDSVFWGQSEEVEDDALGAIGILRAVQRIETDSSPRAGLELAATSVARTLDADMAAIGLSVPGPVDVIRIIALHPTTGVMLANQEPTLILSKYPLLAKALQSRTLERAAGEHQVSRLATLYRRLGFDVQGPLTVQPLTVGEKVFGVILVGNPNSQRKLTAHDEKILQAAAAALGHTIAGERGEGSRPGVEEARGEARRMAERAEQLEAELERQRQQTEELATKLRMREKELDEEEEASTALKFWKEEVRELAETRDTLQDQLSQWKEKAKMLSEVKGELEQRLRQVSSAADLPDDGRFGGILVSDRQGRIILASQATPRLLGQPRAELLDASLEALFDQPLWKRTVRRLLEKDKQPGSVTPISLTVGERTVQAELAHLPENESWSGQLAVVFYLADGSTVQGEMVASLVQELRTPMTSISGYTDLLLGEKVGILGESQHQFLLRIEANIERMEALLNDLIKATDIDAGQIDLVPEPVDTVEIIENVLETFSAQLDDKELEARVDLESDLPPVHADRDSLRQVVHNLISNATLASKPGTEIVIRAYVEEHPDEIKDLPGYVLVSVTDTGGGIAPEYQRHVFQRFYRAKNPLIEGLGATGVGLSVAKALVEANGGRIWVESEMDVGSTFSFILPLSPTEELQDLEPIQEASEAQQ